MKNIRQLFCKHKWVSKQRKKLFIDEKVYRITKHGDEIYSDGCTIIRYEYHYECKKCGKQKVMEV